MKLTSILDKALSAVLEIATRLGPWVAPLPPAYVAYRATSVNLGYPLWAALALACTLEIEGITVAHLFMRMRRYSRIRNKRMDAPAPQGVATGLIAGYLVSGIVLTLTLAMDELAEVVVPVLSYILAMIVYVTLAMMDDQAVRERDRLERLSKLRKKPAAPKAKPPRVPPTRDEQIKAAIAELEAQGIYPSNRKIAELTHLKYTTVWRIRQQWTNNPGNKT